MEPNYMYGQPDDVYFQQASAKGLRERIITQVMNFYGDDRTDAAIDTARKIETYINNG